MLTHTAAIILTSIAVVILLGPAVAAVIAWEIQEKDDD